MTDVRLERLGPAALVTIDRPSAHNAISRPTMNELECVLDELERSDIRALAVRGAGTRVFVSGGDLKELATIKTADDAQSMALRMRAILDRLASLPVPVVGAINGHAFGGGCEVAMACDFRIAADDITLAFNQVDLGIMPAWGGVERLQDIVGRARSLYLLTTGTPIGAVAAADWGLVEEVVPRDLFDERVAALLERLGTIPRAALVGIKAAATAHVAAARPDLAPKATASFAATWVGEAHWTAVAEIERRRRQHRAAEDALKAAQ